MKLSKTIILTAISVILSNTSWASGSEGKTYLNFELGASFSMDAKMDVPEGQSNAASGGGFWDPAPQGYDSDLGNSENYGIGFGYKANPLVYVELNYNYRPSFSYSKYQTPSPSSIGPRNRYFDLENKSLMLNGVINLNEVSESMKYKAGSFTILPYLDAGVGISRNTVNNFHSVATNSGYVFSKMESKTVTSPAFQAGFGLSTALDKFWEIKLGYRYFYGGKFQSQNYITDDPDNLHSGNPGAGTLVPAWEGTLQSNEIYARLVYNF